MALKLQKALVDIWYLPLGERTAAELLQAANHLISAEEFQRSQQYLMRQSQISYLTARAFLRAVLSQYTNVSPQSWRFHTGPHGKPEIGSPAVAQALRFNLAKTDRIVTCAITLNRDIGIDAEATDRAVEMDQLADLFFAPAERADLRKLADDARRSRFFEYWVLKEAYVKARGRGLSLPLDKFAFVGDRNQPIDVTFDSSLDDDPRNWHFALFRPTQKHLVAIALVRGRDEEQAHWRSDIEVIVRPFTQDTYKSAIEDASVKMPPPLHNAAGLSIAARYNNFAQRHRPATCREATE
jgi:4'-phosphopantetheinyl transferase